MQRRADGIWGFTKFGTFHHGPSWLAESRPNLSGGPICTYRVELVCQDQMQEPK